VKERRSGEEKASQRGHGACGGMWRP